MKGKFLTLLFLAGLAAIFLASFGEDARAESDYLETTGNCSTHYPLGSSSASDRFIVQHRQAGASRT